MTTMQLTIEASTSKAKWQLGLIELGFEYAQLRSRADALGSHAPGSHALGVDALEAQEERELRALRALFDGDPRGPREHRRFEVQLPAVLETVDGPSRAGARSIDGPRHGMLLNYSCAGLYLLSGAAVRPGARLRIKLGRAGHLEYLYDCTVAHVCAQQGLYGIGCRVEALPEERRRWGHTPRLPSAQGVHPADQFQGRSWIVAV
jgi:hypothetical protein